MIIFKKYFWIGIVVLTFIFDQLAKTIILGRFIPEESVSILPFLNLYLTFNFGAAFGFLNQADGWQGCLFSIIAILVSLFLIIWQLKIPITNLWLKTSLALILGGTLGNLCDRICYHMVIDFIDFYFRNWHYPTFNLADAAICTGAFMLTKNIMFDDKKTRN
jgi:signal peptidase II